MANEVHGSLAELKIGSAADDTLTKVTGGNSSSLSEAIDTAEVTEFEDDAKRYIAGLEDATLSFEASYNRANIQHIRAIKGTERSFEYYPAGNTSDEEKLSGKLLITSIERSSGIDGASTISAEFQVTGGVTAATVS